MMIKLKFGLIVFLSLHLPNCVNAQINLVPNWSFEEYYYQKNYEWNDYLDSTVKEWNDYTFLDRSMVFSAGGYCNSDANNTNIWVGTPLNLLGYQYPVHGKAYLLLSMRTYKDSINPSYRNIRGAKLKSPMKIGSRYQCSFNLSPAEKSNMALNKFGMLFFTNETNLGIGKNEAYKNQKWPNRAHILSDSILFDTTRWYKIEQEFVADSAYAFVLIGNFFNLDSLTYKQITYDSTLPAHYSTTSFYYLDAVEVFELSPKVYSNKYIICKDDTVNLKAKYLDSSNTWYINNSLINEFDSIIVRLSKTDTFYLKKNNHVYDSIIIEVIDNSLEILPPDLELCQQLSININSLINADKFLWNTGDTNKQIVLTNAGTYWLKASIGNCILIDSIIISSCGAHFFIPNAFSPNGDGINDVFEPKATRILAYKLFIYDAWGKEIYILDDKYNRFWDGQNFSNGVYFYKGYYIDEMEKTFGFKGNFTLLK